MHLRQRIHGLAQRDCDSILTLVRFYRSDVGYISIPPSLSHPLDPKELLTLCIAMSPNKNQLDWLKSSIEDGARHLDDLLEGNRTRHERSSFRRKSGIDSFRDAEVITRPSVNDSRSNDMESSPQLTAVPHSTIKWFAHSIIIGFLSDGLTGGSGQPRY